MSRVAHLVSGTATLVYDPSSNSQTTRRHHRTSHTTTVSATSAVVCLRVIRSTPSPGHHRHRRRDRPRSRAVSSPATRVVTSTPKPKTIQTHHHHPTRTHPQISTLPYCTPQIHSGAHPSPKSAYGRLLCLPTRYKAAGFRRACYEGISPPLPAQSAAAANIPITVEFTPCPSNFFIPAEEAHALWAARTGRSTFSARNFADFVLGLFTDNHILNCILSTTPGAAKSAPLTVSNMILMGRSKFQSPSTARSLDGPTHFRLDAPVRHFAIMDADGPDYHALITAALIDEISLTDTPANPNCIVTSRRDVSAQAEFYGHAASATRRISQAIALLQKGTHHVASPG